MKKARCKRDILNCISDELANSVIHSTSSHDMWRKIERLFLGSSATQLRETRQRLAEFRFLSDYFKFVTGFKDLVNRLNSLGGLNSWRDTSLMFLNKLPKEHAAAISPLRKEQVVQSIVEYLQDAGLYSIRYQYGNSTAKPPPGKSFIGPRPLIGILRGPNRCFNNLEKTINANIHGLSCKVL